MLMDSLSKGKMRRSKIFGAALEDLPVSSRGLPKIVEQLTSHLELYGKLEFSRMNIFLPYLIIHLAVEN